MASPAKQVFDPFLRIPKSGFFYFKRNVFSPDPSSYLKTRKFRNQVSFVGTSFSVTFQDPSRIPSKMQLQTQIIVGLCACVAFVQCQEQVTVGKVGTKTFILLEDSETVDWDTSESLCKAKGLELAALENPRENDLVSAFVVKRAPITKLS
ncbi:unnamed protein product, partial [Allacma fusca]